MAVTNQFRHVIRSRNDPPRWAAVTPSDGTELGYFSQQIRVAVGGNVVVVYQDGTESTMAFADGETRIVECIKVKATGTTATGIEYAFVIPWVQSS